jgi:hypothetical protein
MAKLKINLNDGESVRQLAQEIYLLSETQLIQAQNEINKLANATQLQDEPMDSKAKYAKAINDFMSIKDKAIGMKLQVAKLLAEVMAHKGNVNEAMNDIQAGSGMIDFKKIKEMVKEVNSAETEENKKIELNKK